MRGFDGKLQAPGMPAIFIGGFFERCFQIFHRKFGIIPEMRNNELIVSNAGGWIFFFIIVCFCNPSNRSRRVQYP